MDKHHKTRFLIVFSIMLLIVIGFIVKLYFMQIVNGEEYVKTTELNYSHMYVDEAVRGEIYDRNGNILAYNVKSYNLFFHKAYKTTKQLNAAVLRLFNILEKNNDECFNNLDQYFIFDKMQFNEDLIEQDILKWQMNKDLFNLKEDEVFLEGEQFFEFMKQFFEIDEIYSDLEAYKIMIFRYEIQKNRWYWLSNESLLVSKNISNETLAEVFEQKHHLLGISIRPSMTREYSEVINVAHVLGYMGMVTEKDVLERGYNSDDTIGISGIEAFKEDSLKGVNGQINVITDAYGNVIQVKEENKAIDGNNQYLTIDMNLQNVAMDSLIRNIEIIKSKAKIDDDKNYADANAGAVVALDIKTGEVLVMASFPTYDPNWFIHKDNQSEQNKLKALFDTIGTPMYNRAIQTTYTPGSTFKPIVAIAGLEENIITKDTLIEDKGHEVIGDWDFYCLEYISYGYTHGKLNVIEAIKKSCNMFFYKLGVDIKIDNIDKWAAFLGLGKKTGIDLYGEAEGIRSNPDFKYSREFEKWYIADTAQSSIGQLYHNYTPLQLANYTATLANGGKVLVPYVIKHEEDSKGNIIYEGTTKSSQVPWSDETYNTIKEAMASVVLDGTAEKVFNDFPIEVAGKTGTAETGREMNESSNGVFICYAPVNDPKIAIAVVIEHGVWGSYTAPVAKDILAEYFGLNYNY